MKVALGQFPLVWEDIDANLDAWSERLKTLANDVDLIVLPEMFTTGFSMHVAEIAEPMDGKAVRWLKQQAEKLSVTILGSIICGDEEKVYNRAVLAKSDGAISNYDKRHLFTFADEDKHFTAGTARMIVEVNGWKVCPLVCYDLRFPVWSRNSKTPEKQYDLLIYMANWPAARSAAWTSLLHARAHENQAFVIGVNRVGVDGKGIEYIGNSAVIDPKGNVLTEGDSGKEGWVITDLNREELLHYRDKFRALNDADEFELKL